MACIVAPSVFQKRPAGQLAGVIGNRLRKTQCQIITTHISIGTAFIFHTAAAHSAKHFRTAVSSQLYRAGHTAARNCISAAIDKSGCRSLCFHRRFALFCRFTCRLLILTVKGGDDAVAAQLSCKFVFDTDALLKSAINNIISFYSVAVSQQIDLIAGLQNTGRA